jgi:hypothetical protein
MGETPLDNATLGLTDSGWADEAPLWFYILKESERAPSNGRRLGPVGGRIVAEVMLGILDKDSTSYVNHPTPWKPLRPIGSAASKFGMHDLIKFADVIQGS